MSQVVSVAIHPSQFPENVLADLRQSLRTRQVNHKFLYDSVRQTEKWLALHEACSPSRNDPDCAATYDDAFAATAGLVRAKSVHLVGLGCGGGQKDTRLLKLLKGQGRKLAYTPSDVSVALVLVARRAALAAVAARDCHPLVCDLASADDLAGVISRQTLRGARRLLTFFGMIPNFEPQRILPKLASLLRPADYLLFSANLAPGPDYAGGVRRILPQYDNELTREWLLAFLMDLGVEPKDGALKFRIEERPARPGLKRVAAYFLFRRRCVLRVGGETFEFAEGEAIRLFFSYRHTPKKVRALLRSAGIAVLEEWITRSQEEGVFLCRKQVRRARGGHVTAPVQSRQHEARSKNPSP